MSRPQYTNEDVMHREDMNKLAPGTSMAAFLLLILVSIGRISSASAADIGDKKSPVEINAKSMIAENKKNIITFEGSVVAKKDSASLFSDRMVVHYDNERKIEKIFAYEKVKLIEDDKEITADEAVYLAAEDTVVFTGNPVFRQGANTVAGTKITYFIKGERSVVENSRVILHE
jgi:lipopolysaccharide export system protein LptA